MNNSNQAAQANPRAIQNEDAENSNDSNDRSDRGPSNSAHLSGAYSSEPPCEADENNLNYANQAARANPREIHNEAAENARDVKRTMPIVELGEEESAAIQAVLDGDSDTSGSIDMDQDTPEIVLAPDETAFWDDGVLKVKKKYSEECEITYTYGSKFTPKNPVFEVKMNDPLSMNIPFIKNVSFLQKLLNYNFLNATFSVFHFCEIRKTAIEPI